jgi:NADH:ubiquinone oxidoreductase subunit F (NADH-binding)
VDVKSFLHACMRFFLHESCGSCNPCRNGLKTLFDITRRLKEHEAYPDDIDCLEEISLALKVSAFCPLGQSPASPIMSALRYFRDEIKTGLDPQAVKPKPVHTRRNLMTAAR